jgi:L-lactate dehydrogenase complex protein LldG
MSGREAILAKVRRAAGVSGTDMTRRAAVMDRLVRAPKGVIPARGQLEQAERVSLFRQKAEAVHATTVQVADYDSVPEAVSAYLRAGNLPQALRMGGDTRLAGIAWTAAPHLTVLHGPSDGSDLVCLSHADGGVAETGTLVMTSGPDNPTTLNFLPDYHVVIVDAETIAGDFESVWDVIRGRFGVGVMPRTVNMISGPSRSADIEQTMLLGAHGPRSLHIVVVG